MDTTLLTLTLNGALLALAAPVMLSGLTSSGSAGTARQPAEDARAPVVHHNRGEGDLRASDGADPADWLGAAVLSLRRLKQSPPADGAPDLAPALAYLSAAQSLGPMRAELAQARELHATCQDALAQAADLLGLEGDIDHWPAELAELRAELARAEVQRGTPDHADYLETLIDLGAAETALRRYRDSQARLAEAERQARELTQASGDDALRVALVTAASVAGSCAASAPITPDHLTGAHLADARALLHG
ncbi:hypothetical protein [Pseudooceanicola sp. 200-1SW]|uniref:hypothetical protein n=1 Tax=Pseudooceanicola sp. 200-1SW TaxID=3425949 RepID=UPI003D7F9754